MNAKKRSKLRNKCRLVMSGPYIWIDALVPANAIVKFKTNPWSIFKR